MTAATGWFLWGLAAALAVAVVWCYLTAPEYRMARRLWWWRHQQRRADRRRMVRDRRWGKGRTVR